MTVIKKKDGLKKSWLKTKIMMLGLVAIMLGLLLVGCGNTVPGDIPANTMTAKSTHSTGSTSGQPATVPATTAPAATVSVTTLPATTAPSNTTKPVPVPTATPDTTKAPAPTATPQPQPIYNPVLQAAPQTKVMLGGALTLNGSGYPADLALQVVGGVQNPSEQYGSIKTDAQGRFSLAIKLPQTGIVPGLYFIYASSADFKYQAKVQLDVQPAASPVLEAGRLQVSPGQEVMLRGSGYPANLDLELVGGVQNPNEQYGHVKTDAQGSFQVKVKLPAKGLTPGIYFIYASNADFVYQAKVQLSING